MRFDLLLPACDIRAGDAFFRRNRQGFHGIG
jgi:hypothetical protein